MGQNENKGSGGSSSAPQRQAEGQARHLKHLAEQERERRLRRGLDPVKVKRKKRRS